MTSGKLLALFVTAILWSNAIACSNEEEARDSNLSRMRPAEFTYDYAGATEIPLQLERRLCFSTDEVHCQFRNIQWVLPRSNGNFVVSDGMTILQEFDSSGRWLHSIGRAGLGPGEFTIAGATSENVSDHGLNVLEIVDLRILKFDSTNRYVAATTARRLPGEVKLRGDRYAHMVIDVADSLGWPAHAQIVTSTLDGMDSSRIAEFVAPAVALRGKRWMVDHGPPFSARVLWDFDGKETAVAINGLSFSFGVFRNGTRMITVECDVPDPVVTDAMRDSVTRLFRSLGARSNAVGFAGNLEQKLAHLPTFRPSIGSIHLTDDGFIWVRSEVPTTVARDGTQQGRWDIFDTTGARHGFVLVPTSARLMHATRDRVVVTQEDGELREFVAIYRVRLS